MPDINERGHTIPDALEAARPWANLVDALVTVNDMPPVANTSARATLVSDLTTAGAMPGVLLVGREDATAGKNLEFTLNGTDWYAPDARNTAPVTSGVLTVASGWTLNAQEGCIRNGIAYVYLSVTRTGGTITSGATGNIVNTTCANLNAGWIPAIPHAGMISSTDGQMAAGHTSSSGAIQVVSTVVGVNIVNTDIISLAGSWPIA